MIATLALAETGGLFDADIGCSVDVSQATTFDHAALVAAKLSRSDGYDLKLFGDSGERITMTSISGANTTTCRIIWNVGQDTLVAGGTLSYSLEYGNLGLQTSPFGGTPGPTAASLGASVSGVFTFPTLTLPVPSFPVGESLIVDVDSVGSDVSPTTRTALRNRNSRLRTSVIWRSLSPSDLYQVRAWVFARLGGAVTFPHTHLSILDSGTYRMVPGSFKVEQMRRLEWFASLEVEEVFV